MITAQWILLNNLKIKNNNVLMSNSLLKSRFEAK